MYREFDCTGCGLNTATQDPSLIECDDCRAEYRRGDMPFPGVGDFCETCVVSCDWCGAEYASQHMLYLKPGQPICPDCDDKHDVRKGIQRQRAEDNARDQYEAYCRERYLGIGL